MSRELFSRDQLAKLTLHLAGINTVLAETLRTVQAPGAPFEPDEEPDTELEFDILVTGINFEDLCEREKKPQAQFIPKNYGEPEHLQREQALNRLCGRWMTSKNRCGVEISRAGEHYILTYLKSNGCPSDERYILIWLDGDILYYGHEDRITVLALNVRNDTLMISPGADYTRVPQSERK
jgi:hypothetical protein